MPKRGKEKRKKKGGRKAWALKRHYQMGEKRQITCKIGHPSNYIYKYIETIIVRYVLDN